MTYPATSPEVTGVTGEYFDDCEQGAPSDAATDRDAARRLRRASAEWTDLDDESAVSAVESRLADS